MNIYVFIAVGLFGYFCPKLAAFCAFFPFIIGLLLITSSPGDSGNYTLFGQIAANQIAEETVAYAATTFVGAFLGSRKETE
jgi:hypothetical protein